MKNKVICERATYDPIVGNGTLCHYIIFTMWAAFAHKSDLSNGPQIHVDLNWTKLFEFDHLFFQVIYFYMYIIMAYMWRFQMFLTLFATGYIFTGYFHVIIWRFENKICFFFQLKSASTTNVHISTSDGPAFLYTAQASSSVSYLSFPHPSHTGVISSTAFFHFPWSICWFVYTSQSPPIS